MSEDKNERIPIWKWIMLAAFGWLVVAWLMADEEERASEPVKSETSQPAEVKPEAPAKPVEMVKKLSGQTYIAFQTSGRLGDNLVDEKSDIIRYGEISCVDAFKQFRRYAKNKYSLSFEVSAMSEDKLSYNFRDTRDRTFYLKTRCTEATYKMVPKE